MARRRRRCSGEDICEYGTLVSEQDDVAGCGGEPRVVLGGWFWIVEMVSLKLDVNVESMGGIKTIALANGKCFDSELCTESLQMKTATYTVSGCFRPLQQH